MKFCYLDFEFNGTAEAKLNLVSVACVCTNGGAVTYEREFWLYGEKYAGALSFFRHVAAEGYIFVGFTEAEPRSLLTLGLDKFEYVDLYLEYRLLLNHNNRLAYGPQYIDGKEIVTTPPPNKWVAANYLQDEDEDEEGSHHKPQYSLAACTYKLLRVKLDTEEKNEVRDIIIRGNKDEILANIDRISTYNKSDIIYLPRILNVIAGWFRSLTLSNSAEWLAAAKGRGDYSIRTAKMIGLGYPVNKDKLTAFRANTSHILKEAAEACIAEGVSAFLWNKKLKRYSVNEHKVREWIAANPKPHWRLTPGKKLSLSKDAFGDWFDSASSGFGGAFYRYLKTKQSLNGFMPGGESKRGKFSDFVGTDGRVRPHFGIYGSQSSRSQPKATGFIPLKAHWMRNFIEPPPGKALAGIDYASQEFLIAAILSQDKAMMAAYATGDVYLAFAKDAKLIPASGDKKSHPKERNAAKTVVLGISYDMAAKSLAHRLSEATGDKWGEPEAQRLIDLFFAAYKGYADWKERTLNSYQDNHYLALPDGWAIWGDNRNRRSVANFPVQGHGAVVMREAVRLAQDCGLDVIFTLHDALYIEFNSSRPEAVVTLMQCMQRAFHNVMSQYGETVPIRLEGESWSPDYAGVASPIPDVVFMSEYVDDKGRADLERYRKYLSTSLAQVQVINS